MQCQRQTQQPANSITVTTSFYPLYYFAAYIGGDKAKVTNLTPAGAEPHDFEPSPANMVQIAKSNLLILNGLGIEPWSDNVKKNINLSRTMIIVAGEGLNQGAANDQKNIDPHVWLSPFLAKQMVDKIAQGFVASDSTNLKYYLSNAESLKTRLDAMDKSFSQGLAVCSTHDIITSHAAFAYLAANYGLRQIAITGLSPDAEPSPKQIANIASFAKTNNIKYIFFESLVSPKIAQTIADEVGAQTLILNPIEGLTYREQLEGKDYFSLMKDNLAILEKALQCKP